MDAILFIVNYIAEKNIHEKITLDAYLDHYLTCDDELKR